MKNVIFIFSCIVVRNLIITKNFLYFDSRTILNTHQMQVMYITQEVDE